MARVAFKREGGFALAELMVVLTLLGVVLGLGYLYFDFGTRTFARGERQSIAQQSIRLGVDFITSEIRFADQVALLAAGSAIPPGQTGYHYIFQHADGRIVYQDRSGTQRVLLDSTADQIVYRLTFAEEEAVSGIDFTLVLSYTLTADVDLYSLQTSTHIMNLVNSANYTKPADPSIVITAIQYSKPWE